MLQHAYAADNAATAYDASPAMSSVAVSDADLDAMAADLADARRCEDAINESDIERMHAAEAIAVAAKPAAESRVGVKGKMFQADARVAGGRWVYAGVHRTEAAAWHAARAQAAALLAHAQKSA